MFKTCCVTISLVGLWLDLKDVLFHNVLYVMHGNRPRIKWSKYVISLTFTSDLRSSLVLSTLAH